MTKTLLFSAGLALTMAAGVAEARSAPVEVIGQRIEDDQLSHRVAYGDIDLAADSGQKRLDRRVRQAVSIVCAPLDGTNLRTKQQACRSYAWQGAKPQMARAIERARQLAATGTTAIPEVAISVVAPSVR